jgi:hypothetical protein
MYREGGRGDLPIYTNYGRELIQLVRLSTNLPLILYLSKEMS